MQNLKPLLSETASFIKSKGFLNSFGLLLMVSALGAGVYAVRNPQLLTSRAKLDSASISFVHPTSHLPVTTISDPQVTVKINVPWPISFLMEGQVAAAKTEHDSDTGTNSQNDSAKSKPKTTSVPRDKSKQPTATPGAVEITASILLSEDSSFSSNVTTISPVNTNPVITNYTFSNPESGVKTLHVKFVSSRGSSVATSKSIQLVNDSAIPTGSKSQPPSTTPDSPENRLPVSGNISPNAPLCPPSAHNNSVFHTLWNEELGCHYDHEHGTDPLTPDVSSVFPGFNLLQLTDGVSIGHTNPSSAMENTHKHGGFKWFFMSRHPEGCLGFEGAENGVNGSLVQLHSFGDSNMELTGRIHSSLALLRLCNTSNPNDYGYLYTIQFQDYGQIISPYQGDILPLPFQPQPAYDPPRGPYLSIDCVGQKTSGERGACRTSLQEVINRRLAASSLWTSKPTGRTNVENPFGSTLFNVLFRVRDTYQLVDWSDKTYPLTYKWICSSDGGDTFNPQGCRYTNSTVQLHEIAGRIPSSWDNLSGFDTNSRIGRITATGYTDRYGTLNRNCTAPRVSATGNRSEDCFPVQMVNAPVGTYGSILVYTGASKGTNIVPYLPSRDIFFCNGRVCSETDAGAVPSGWIGPSN